MSALIDALREAASREDRATLAALRRGLGKSPGDAPEMFPIVVPRLPDRGGAWVEHCHYLVAALFASHPQDWRGESPGWNDRNLGASMWRFKAAANQSEGPERRFVALLGTHADDVGTQLQSIVGLLRSKDVAVDWEQLLIDLQRWSRDDREVQRRWARSFWAAEHNEEGERDDNEAD